MDDRNSLVQATPVVPQQTAHPLAVLWSIIGGVLLLVFLFAGMIAARSTFLQGAQLVVLILIGLAIVGIPGSVIVAAVMIYQQHKRKARIVDMELSALQRLSVARMN
jgi:hypothetical protein